MAPAFPGRLAGMQFVCRRCVCLAAEGFSQCAPDGARGSPRAREVSRDWALDEGSVAGPAHPMGILGKATRRSEGAT